jgi:hypothetical protein
MNLKNVKSASVATTAYATLAAAKTALQNDVHGAVFDEYPDGTGFYFSGQGFSRNELYVATGGVVYCVTLVPGNA